MADHPLPLTPSHVSAKCCRVGHSSANASIAGEIAARQRMAKQLPKKEAMVVMKFAGPAF